MASGIDRYDENFYNINTKYTTHLEDINTNIIQQFKLDDCENIKSLMTICSNEYDDIQTDIQALQTEVWLDTAIGEQLDQIGSLIGRQRLTSQSDDDYRDDLETQILVITNEATLEDVLCILSRKTGHSDDITDKDVQVISSSHGTSFVYFKNIDDLLSLSSAGTYYSGVLSCDDLLAAGVGADVHVLDDSCTWSFGFADDDDNADDTDAGFGADDEDYNDDAGCMFGYLADDPNMDIDLLFTLDTDGDGGGFGSDDDVYNSDSGAFWASYQLRHDPCELEDPYVTKT